MSARVDAIGAARRRRHHLKPLALDAGDEATLRARRSAAAKLELGRARHHLLRAYHHAASHPFPPTTKVKGTMTHHTDMPLELSEQYDGGVTDSALFKPEIIGCGPVSGLGSLAVGAGLQHLSVSGTRTVPRWPVGKSTGPHHLPTGYYTLERIGAGLQQLAVSGGLHDLAVAGLPGYLFTRKSLQSPVVRRRIAAAIKAMTPKLRRRVLARLRQATAIARVSGAIRQVTPSIAGGVGWTASSVSVGRCPYANVAGSLTP